MQRPNIGLVLTGGGARAAFQVGAVKALAASPLNCAAISGVGAGALNGLILAAAPDLQSGQEQLERCWANAVLSPNSALQIGRVPVTQLGVYLTLLYAGGADPAIHEVLKAAGRDAGNARRARSAASIPTGKADAMMQIVEMVSDLLNVATDAQLDAILSTTLGNAAANVRLPFYVSTHRSGDGAFEQLKLMLQGVGILNPGDPSFLPVHTMPRDERLAAVLASAALPFACGAREVGGTVLIDGSYGGLASSASAVPTAPLLRAKGLDAIIVVHTDLSSPFDASGAQGVPIFEITPTISSDEAEVGYFWASAAALGRWMDQGERDARDKVDALLDAMDVSTSFKLAHARAREAGDRLDKLEHFHIDR